MKNSRVSVFLVIPTVVCILQGCDRQVSPDEYNALVDRLLTPTTPYEEKGIFLAVSPDRERLYVVSDQVETAIELLDAEMLAENRWNIRHADGDRIDVSVFRVDSATQLAEQYSSPVDQLMAVFPDSSCVQPIAVNCTRVFAGSELHRKVEFTKTTVIRPGSLRCTGYRAVVGAEETYPNLGRCQQDDKPIRVTAIAEDVCIPENCR